MYPYHTKELFKKFRDDYNNRIEAVETALDTLECEEDTNNYIKNIANYESMFQEIQTLIRSAKREIYISIWEEEALLFKEDFEEAYQRGVSITVFSFNKIPISSTNAYSYGIPSDELKKLWSRPKDHYYRRPRKNSDRRRQRQDRRNQYYYKQYHAYRTCHRPDDP